MNPPLEAPRQVSRLKARALDLLPLLARADQGKFLKKFKSEDSQQAAHSARELFLGVFLLNNGFKVRYEALIGANTPDWGIFREDGTLAAAVDQLTFHQAAESDHEMNAAFRSGYPWVGWVPDNTPRLYQKLVEKSEKYTPLAVSLRIPIVVGLFSDFFAAVERDELHEALFRAYGGGVFRNCTALSGVIFSQEFSGTYHFEYILNPQATHSLAIVGGQV